MNSSIPRHPMRAFESETMQLRPLRLAQTLLLSLLIVATCLLFPRPTFGQPQTTTINFDQLPAGSVVINQYQPKVTFSATGFCSCSGGFYGFDLYAEQFPTFSSNKAIMSDPNQGRGNPFWNHGFGDVYVGFSLPVNNLNFKILNYFRSHPQNPGEPAQQINIYVNGFYYTTRYVYGTYQQGTIPVNLSDIQSITGIAILNPRNYDSFGGTVPTYYDDFTFTPYFDVKITNARVSGYLNETTQTALVGADVALQTIRLPSTETGGAYSWSFTGPYSVSGGSTSSSSVTIRSTDVGTITARVTYTRNGFTASGSVTINAVLPTLTSFTAQQGSDLISPPSSCGSPYWWYRLGCYGTSQVGIHFSSRVHAPAFISDPSQSGIKYVQAVSTLRKTIERGLRCQTKRSSESNIGSGWQLDTQDPYVFPEYPVHRFSEGNDLTMLTVDYPGNILTFISDWEFIDSLYVDDRFEMYVVYFTGDPAHPPFQKPLGKLAWNWGGLVVFDWNGSNGIHNLRFSNAAPGPRTGGSANSMVVMQGNVQDNDDVPCPGGPPLTINPIDSSRVFVKYHYLDFLERHPAGDQTHPPDLPGWNYWTSQISLCGFDLNCIYGRRINTGLAFFYSGEFNQTDPDMANPPGSPGFNPSVYNRAFVKHCYLKYLRRNPVDDPDGWTFWTNVLNSTSNYGHMIESFITSTEYRNRPFF